MSLKDVRPIFDYNSNELSLTILSISQAKALAHGKGPYRHGESKTQVEAMKIFKKWKTSGLESVQIVSNGCWFVFDDYGFHVWHGDFTEQETELVFVLTSL
ncbi:hypothetical protein BGX21_008661 [Mortierella sp. AD011]|nr:hypothetical protein BGX20_009230 [Mortierella sp. AD010]KAF9397624.1 hypothetical protein BGX21_008661 [Mortierella sp. AD011]